MLAVEAWVAVPFFWIAGPTVGALRSSLVAWNFAFAALLIVGLHRDGGLRTWIAMVPALFFLAAPPSVAKRLMEAQGGIIEPFVYVGLLWFLRRRPLWFGVVLAIGFRNREFSLYAVPVILAIELADRRIDAVAHPRVAAGSGDVSRRLGIDRRAAAFRRSRWPGHARSAARRLLGITDREPGRSRQRAARPDGRSDRPRMGPRLVAWFAGAAQVETSLPLPDRPWLAWMAAVLLVAAAPSPRGPGRRPEEPSARPGGPHPVCVVFARRRHRRRCGVHGRETDAARLLAIRHPWPVDSDRRDGGAAGARTAPGASAHGRSAVVAWASIAVVDNVTVLLINIRRPPPNPVRELADGLIARRFRSHPVDTGTLTLRLLSRGNVCA